MKKDFKTFLLEMTRYNLHNVIQVLYTDVRVVDVIVTRDSRTRLRSKLGSYTARTRDIGPSKALQNLHSH